MPNSLLQFLFQATLASRARMHQYPHESGDAVAAMTMGCVLLRGMAIRERRIFSSLTADEFLLCRSQLLEALRDEGIPTPVRRTLCNTIAAISGIHFDWPELIGYIQEKLSASASATSVNSVRLCFFLLGTSLLFSVVWLLSLYSSLSPQQPTQISHKTQHHSHHTHITPTTQTSLQNTLAPSS